MRVVEGFFGFWGLGSRSRGFGLSSGVLWEFRGLGCRMFLLLGLGPVYSDVGRRFSFCGVAGSSARGLNPEP